MASRTARKAKSVAEKSTELAMAVPWVVAHRVARMAVAGPNVSARDREELTLMFAEKTTAFAQAWTAMTMQALSVNQALAASMLRAAWTPASWGGSAVSMLADQAHRGALGIVEKGLDPVHGAAVANAKRLGRRRVDR